MSGKERLLTCISGGAVVAFACSVAAYQLYGRTKGDFFSAAQGGNLMRAEEVLRWLPWLVNSEDRLGNTPLHYSVWYGQGEVAHYLIDKGARIDVFIAAGLGMDAVVAKMLVDDPECAKRVSDIRLRTPLHWAAIGGNARTAEILLERGANLEAMAAGGLTPLRLAAESGNASVARLLLEKGAAVDSKSSQGSTPLYEAVCQKHSDVAALLVQHGADVTAERPGGMSTFSAAVGSGPTWLVELMLSRGIDVNRKDRSGNSYLHIAVRLRQIDTVRLLLAHGADTSLKDREGKTAWHLAAERQDKDIADLIATYPRAGVKKSEPSAGEHIPPP